jgi:hypothetical protein
MLVRVHESSRLEPILLELFVVIMMSTSCSTSRRDLFHGLSQGVTIAGYGPMFEVDLGSAGFPRLWRRQNGRVPHDFLD